MNKKEEIILKNYQAHFHLQIQLVWVYPIHTALSGQPDPAEPKELIFL